MAGSTFESLLKIGVILALFQSLGIIPLEITKLKICVREDAIDGNETFRRQVGIPSRPPALPTGISFTSLRSPSIVSNSSSKVLYRPVNISGLLRNGPLGPLVAKSAGFLAAKKGLSLNLMAKVVLSRSF